MNCDRKITFFDLVNAITFVQVIAGLDVSEELSGEFEYSPNWEKIHCHICKGYHGGETQKLLIKCCLQF